MKERLDKALVTRKMVSTRSQAESWIRMKRVSVDGKLVEKAGHFVSPHQKITLEAPEQYVSRAGLKLASVAQMLSLDFNDKIVLDVGSSTGGFTDYALQHGAKKVYAVDVGTDQLHESLQGDARVELHEKTDIRDFSLSDTRRSKLDSREKSTAPASSIQAQASSLDIVVIDVSFISLRDILPHVSTLSGPQTQIVAMVKPQFEAHRDQITKTGIVKNDRARRDILRDFEVWARQYFVISDKADSEVAGRHGNKERFYDLRLLVG